jgi:hypothetical protein
MEKEIKIQVPEGYEIDKEKSTFERIVFKKKKAINCWKDLEKISGYGITTENDIVHWSELTTIEENKNVFLNEKYAKSALALAQISQLLPYYDSNVDWYKVTDKYCLVRIGSSILIETWQSSYHRLAFNSRGEAKRFLKYNEQLVKDYFML